MSGLEKDTIGGFNSFIKNQKEVEGEALVSTILFSEDSQVLHDRIPLKNVKKLTQKNFTVLSEAIGDVRRGRALSSEWKQDIEQYRETKKKRKN